MVRRTAVLTAVAWLLLCATAALAAPEQSCAQRVLDDWFADGRIEGVYRLTCYRAAIRALPTDLLDYSSADDDITRALAYARRLRTEPRSSGTPADDAIGSRLASAGSTDARAVLPYPLIVLGGLATTLLAAGSIVWLLSRRR